MVKYIDFGPDFSKVWQSTNWIFLFISAFNLLRYRFWRPGEIKIGRKCIVLSSWKRENSWKMFFFFYHCNVWLMGFCLFLSILESNGAAANFCTHWELGISLVGLFCQRMKFLPRKDYAMVGNALKTSVHWAEQIFQTSTHFFILYQRLPLVNIIQPQPEPSWSFGKLSSSWWSTIFFKIQNSTWKIEF